MFSTYSYKDLQSLVSFEHQNILRNFLLTNYARSQDLNIALTLLSSLGPRGEPRDSAIG